MTVLAHARCPLPRGFAELWIGEDVGPADRERVGYRLGPEPFSEAAVELSLCLRQAAVGTAPCGGAGGQASPILRFFRCRRRPLRPAVRRQTLQVTTVKATVIQSGPRSLRGLTKATWIRLDQPHLGRAEDPIRQVRQSVKCQVVVQPGSRVGEEHDTGPSTSGLLLMTTPPTSQTTVSKAPGFTESSPPFSWAAAQHARVIGTGERP